MLVSRARAISLLTICNTVQAEHTIRWQKSSYNDSLRPTDMVGHLEYILYIVNIKIVLILENYRLPSPTSDSHRKF